MDIAASDYQANSKNLIKQAEIKFCLDELHSPVPATRANAINRLVQLEAGMDEIVRCLDDSKGIVREAAAGALGKFQICEVPKEGIEGLLSAIDDADNRVCSAAISSLGRLAVEEARDPIEQLLTDANPLVVGASIVALARLGSQNVVETLMVYLESDNHYLQVAAVRACNILRYEPAGMTLLAHLEQFIHGKKKSGRIMPEIIEALGSIKVQAAIPLLIEIAQNHVGLRSKAITALIEMNTTEAAPVLAYMLADPGVTIRTSLIKLFVKTKYESAPLLLRPLLQNPNTEVRKQALLALREFNDKASIAVIHEMCFKDSNPHIRGIALELMCYWLGEEMLPDLVTLSQDTNVVIRKLVASNLGNILHHTQESLQTLSALANDPLEDIQLAAKEALSKLNETPVKTTATSSPILTPLIPGYIFSQRDSLITNLKVWQMELPSFSGRSDLSELTQLDQALTVMISYLERGISVS